jgi:uncharacterized membrane protein
MYKKLFSVIKPLFKSLLLIGIVLGLALGHPDGALAARSGGRIGGGSFRAPSRTYAPPSRTYAPPGGGGYYPSYGGGFGFPFLIPFFGGGGGLFSGLFSILIFFAIANFALQTFRRISSGSEDTNELGSTNPNVSVAKVQVGLLANARSLQTELNALAESADTGTDAGRVKVLQESSLALLRHPEYWIYGGAESEQTRLATAEAKFNQLSLAERSKFTEETLSNVNNQLRQAEAKKSLPVVGDSAQLASQSVLEQTSGEYIVVTIIVGVQGQLQFPPIRNTDELRQALRQIGGISSEQLLAVEILWTPQSIGDTLSSDDMIAEYANLKLI